MNKRKLILIFVFCVLSFQLFSQDGPPKIFLQKVFTGGNIQAQFGSYTLIGVTPQIGYRFNKYVSAGIGLNISYKNQNESDLYGTKFRRLVQGDAGLNVFTKVYPFQFLSTKSPLKYVVLSARGEENYIFGKQIFYQPSKETFKLDAIIAPNVLLGGGIVIPVSDKQQKQLTILMMFDVLKDYNSPYEQKPIFNIAYNFNLK